MPELARRDSEPLVQKAYGDSFEETDLEPVLAARSIGDLVAWSGGLYEPPAQFRDW